MVVYLNEEAGFHEGDDLRLGLWISHCFLLQLLSLEQIRPLLQNTILADLYVPQWRCFSSAFPAEYLQEGDDDADGCVIHRYDDLVVSVEFALLGGEFSVVVVVLNAEEVAVTLQHLLDGFFEGI